MNVTATLFGEFLTFGILIWFLMRFLWNPIVNMLEDRKTRIANGLAAAEEGLRSKEKAEEECLEILKVAREEAKEILALAQRRGDEIIEQAKGEARTEGERLLAAARAEIDQQANRAREELRSQVVRIAISGAEQVLMREVDAKVHGDALEKLAAQL